MEFKKISLDNYEKYNEYYKKCMLACSETSFLATWSQSQVYDIEQAFAKDFYWHKKIWVDEVLWLPPVGDWDKADWSELLPELVPAGTVFGFIPEYLLKKWQALGDRLEFTEMRSEWDYVYSIDDKVEAKGKKYKSWRNAINRYIDNEEFSFKAITEEDIEDIKAFQQEWMAGNEGLDKMNDELRHENETIMNFLNNWCKLPNAVGGVVRTKGKVIAYNINEKLDENIVSMHVSKGNGEYTGIMQYAEYMVLTTLLDGYSVINQWGDADLPGLKKNKMNDNPIVLYKKYRVVWKG